MPARDGAAAFEFGVEFGAEQDGYVGDPHPDQEDDDAGEAAVDLVVVAEVGDVEGKQCGGDEPQDDGDEATRADPLEAVLGVRARPEQDGQDQPDDDQQDRPLGDVPHRDGYRADAQRVPGLLRQSPGYQHDDGRRHQQDHRDDGDTQPDRCRLPDRAALGNVIDGVGSTHEGRDIVRRRPQGERERHDTDDPGGGVVRLQAGDVVADDAANRGRRYLADVFDERLGDGVADQAEQGDQDEQAREDRLDAEIGQRRRPVLQVIVLVLPQRSLGRVTPGAAAQVRRVIWCVLAGIAVRTS